MSNSDSGMRRVAVHSETAHADLALPSHLPVATLIASLTELLPLPSDADVLRPYRIGRPGHRPLDGSKTLAQQDVGDGAVLMLSRREWPAPRLRCDDPAERAATAIADAAYPWGTVPRRLTAAAAVTVLAGVAGFVAIPGGPGAPHALVGTAAAGTAALLAVPSCNCTATVRTTLCCLAGLAVLAAVAGTVVALTGIPLSCCGAVATVAGIVVLRAAGRIAAAVTGLARLRDAVVAPVRAAHDVLTGLVVGAAALVPSGVAVAATAAGSAPAPRMVTVAFAASAAAAITLRARSHRDGVQVAALITGGAVTAGIAVLTAAVAAPPLYSAAVAVLLAGTAVGAGFSETAPPPLLRRCGEMLESAALSSALPLMFWLCGIYRAVGDLVLVRS
ncbi:EsaB/YukD family protein [[Mycobacterium] kokjensenii]|uniref:EsaB/YukD family protein n=1 Tax=[Mycobacterium] kokjensenii TaxID=3064287 RepID=A0ABM9LQ44_9MYCO|nr:EsaB/YukD family protein [Mycolicibacter sp. MU0083]CAJ1502802.1 EsaB/YukD family protein [Mycolicibacter sp. MU0083]